MKKIVALISLLAVVVSKPMAQTADQNANQTTKCVLQYLSGLSAKSTKKVLSGQWMNNRGLPETPMTEFDTSITTLYNQTNKWVGIIGTNYTRTHSVPYYIAIENMQKVNQPLINYFKNNGLVAVMTNFKNPWNQTNSGDLTNSSNLLDVVTPGHPANISFTKELDSLAKGFKQLQDSGVTVLFRPFHEMNGNWFWWGSKSSTLPTNNDFTSLWQYTFNYLTTTKNLHNILWMYAPSAKETGVANPSFKTELFYYPGTNYVDVIGLDIYNDSLDIPNYNAIVATNKPIGLAEFGMSKPSVPIAAHAYDYTKLINNIKNKYPAICFWLSWNHFKNSSNNWFFYSLATQNNVSNLISDPWTSNRDDIDYSACLSSAIEENSFLDESISIYPNPFSSQLTIRSTLPLNNATLTLNNYLGQKVIELSKINEQTLDLSRNNLPPGIYLLQLFEGKKLISKNKVIISN